MYVLTLSVMYSAYEPACWGWEDAGFFIAAPPSRTQAMLPPGKQWFIMQFSLPGIHYQNSLEVVALKGLDISHPTLLVLANFFVGG